MFKTNDVIVYGAEGVCRIVGIEEKKTSGVTREYYILKPEDGRKTTLYIPTDNEKLLAKMRRTLSTKEAYALIDAMPDQPPLPPGKNTERKAAFHKILSDGEPSALLTMIKTLYLQQKARESAGKPLLMSEQERLMKAAEELLYRELQYVLDMDRETLMACIFARIDGDSR